MAEQLVQRYGFLEQCIGIGPDAIREYEAETRGLALDAAMSDFSPYGSVAIRLTDGEHKPEIVASAHSRVLARDVPRGLGDLELHAERLLLKILKKMYGPNLRNEPIAVGVNAKSCDPCVLDIINSGVSRIFFGAQGKMSALGNLTLNAEHLIRANRHRIEWCIWDVDEAECTAQIKHLDKALEAPKESDEYYDSTWRASLYLAPTEPIPEPASIAHALMMGYSSWRFWTGNSELAALLAIQSNYMLGDVTDLNFAYNDQPHTRHLYKNSDLPSSREWSL